MLAAGSRQEANISLHAVPALHLSFSTPRKPNGSVPMPQLLETLFGNTIPSEVASETIDPRAGTAEISGVAPGHYELRRAIRRASWISIYHQPTGGHKCRQRCQCGGQDACAWRQGAGSRRITMSLQRVDSGLGQRLDAAQAVQGRFKFDAVPPGEWTLMATTSDKACL